MLLLNARLPIMFGTHLPNNTAVSTNNVYCFSRQLTDITFTIQIIRDTIKGEGDSQQYHQMTQGGGTTNLSCVIFCPFFN